MTELSCAAIRELAPDLALGELPGHERADVLAHLASCPSCTLLVEEISDLADRLLLLAPEDEPRAGFESRVMAALNPTARTAEATRHTRHRRRVRWASAAAAVIVVVGGTGLGVAATRTSGTAGTSGPSKRPIDLGGEYVQALQRLGGRSLRAAGLKDTQGHRVGQAFIYDGAPSWIFVSVDGSGASGNYMVVCTGKDAGPVSWPRLHLADGHGAVGWTAQGDIRRLDKVSVVDESGHATYVATLEPSAT